MFATAITILAAFLFAGLLVSLLVISIHNRLVRLHNRWETAFAQLQVPMRRRYDLIAQWIEVAKNSPHLNPQTLKDVTDACQTAFNAEQAVAQDLRDRHAMVQLIGAEIVLDGVMSRLETSVAAHPTLSDDEQMAELERSARLPLIEIAQGALRRLSPEQYRQFRNKVIQLIKADEKVSLFEFIIQCVLLNHLDRVFELARPAQVRYYSIRGVSDDVAVLLSAIAHVGHRDAEPAEQNYTASMLALQLDSQQAMFLTRDQCTLSRLKTVIKKLATCSMPIKKRILGAATLCVAADGTVTVGEAELLRAVADSLDCPIPPLLPGKLKQAG